MIKGAFVTGTSFFYFFTINISRTQFFNPCFIYFTGNIENRQTIVPGISNKQPQWPRSFILLPRQVNIANGWVRSNKHHFSFGLTQLASSSHISVSGSISSVATITPPFINTAILFICHLIMAGLGQLNAPVYVQNTWLIEFMRTYAFCFLPYWVQVWTSSNIILLYTIIDYNHPFRKVAHSRKARALAKADSANPILLSKSTKPMRINKRLEPSLLWRMEPNNNFQS